MNLIAATLALAGALLLGPGARADVGDQWDGLADHHRKAQHSTALSTRSSAVQHRRTYRTHANGRPVGCPPRLWCGCHLAVHLGIPRERQRRLWLARNWLHEGRRVRGPKVGAVAVFARGRRGGHVGVVTRVIGPGRIVLHSGNDGNRVRERERSTRGVLGYVVLR